MEPTASEQPESSALPPTLKVPLAFTEAAIAKVGENITIARFARFKLGEGGA